MEPLKFFRKRTGRIVKFNPEKIEFAINRAIDEARSIWTGGIDLFTARWLRDKVVDLLNDEHSPFFVKPDTIGSRVPKLEEVQDAVEYVIRTPWADAPVLYTPAFAKLLYSLYSNYRKEREKARASLKVLNNASEKIDVTDKGMLLQETGRKTVNGWDRNRLEKDLEDLMIDNEMVSAIAKRVERAILKSGLRTVSSDLIVELVNNELTAEGIQTRMNSGRGYFIDKAFVDGLVESKSNENSNIVNNNPEAINMAISGYVMKKWAMDNVFSKDVIQNHSFGFIYVHDFSDACKTYCSSHSVEYLKKYGLNRLLNLNTVSKPANSASVLTGHLNTFLASMQAYYAGALGLGYINVFYAPLLKDKSDKELHQIAQELVFNGSQNAFSRGGQTLFLDFNIMTGVPSTFSDIPAIGAGGKYMFKWNTPDEEHISPMTEVFGENGVKHYTVIPEGGTKDDEILVMTDYGDRREYKNTEYGHVMTYSEFDLETRRFCKALLTVWGEGDANGHVFEFPKCDFHVSEETFIDPKQKELFDYACEITAKNGSVYFVFDRDSVSVASCCRLRVKIDKELFSHPETIRSSFPRNMPIVIRRDGNVEVTSMGMLFDETDVASVIENGFEIKYLRDIEIWDRDGWTGLQRVMRHKKNPEMKSDTLRVIRTDSGRMIVVTENHPMIIIDTNVPSKCPKCGGSNVFPMGFTSYGKRVFGCKDCGRYSVGPVLDVDKDSERVVSAENLTFQNAFIDCDDVFVQKTKHLNPSDAYVLGAYVGDGSAIVDRNVCYISKPSDHPTYKKVVEHAKKICQNIGMSPDRVKQYSNQIVFPLTICPEVLTAGRRAYYKQLPLDYLTWNERTFGDVVSGLIDTDGSIHKTDILIASISLTLITQLQMYLRSIGIHSRMYLHNEHPVFDNRVNGKEGFNDTHLAYVLSIRNDLKARSLFRLSWKVRSVPAASTKPPKWSSCERVYNIKRVTDKCEEYVYDVTTDSHTFVVNGLLCHNCGFQNITINIPQCSYRTNIEAGQGDPEIGSETWNLFVSQIDKGMDLAVKAHLQKKKHIARMMSGPGMPLWQVGMPSCDGKPYIDLEKCVYIIGLIGLDDACRYLFGKSMYEDEKLTTWGLSVIAHMNLKVKEYTEKHGITFSLEESPAESAARKLARSDLAHFPKQAKAIVHGAEDAEYYTNSVHIPADAPVALVERITRQAMFHGMIDSGAITHAFIGEETPSAGAIAHVVELAFRLTQSAQITFSPEFTYCLDCGHGERGLKDKCPACGSDNVVGETRVVGYFSRIQNWNKSKRYGELVARHKGRYGVETAGEATK